MNKITVNRRDLNFTEIKREMKKKKNYPPKLINTETNTPRGKINNGKMKK